MVDRMTSLFRDYHLFARRVTQTQRRLALRQFRHYLSAQRTIEQRACRVLSDMAQLCRNPEMVVKLIHITYVVLAEIRHLVDGLRLERREHIVFVRRQHGI